MAKENKGTTKQADETTPAQAKQKTLTIHKGETLAVWDKYVSPAGAVAMTVYLVILSILLLYSIFQFWPPQLSSRGTIQPVEFFSQEIAISVELRLLAVVVFAGALGGQIHSLRSFASYVGNRRLKVSWLVRYFLMPFVAASLALVFYFVIRAAFFTANTTTQNMNVYGFAGLSGLVGLFSTMAVNKLRCMAVELLGPLEQEEDPLREESNTKK
ncbi:MAG: hypothetical protein ACYSUX_18300 [Planctomycetota bacterium]|jgi:hypothetical protein